MKGVDDMGMTDRQFDLHLKGLLRDLKRIQTELSRDGVSNAELDTMIKDLEEQLRRP